MGYVSAVHPLVSDKYDFYDAISICVGENIFDICRAKRKSDEKTVYLMDYRTDGRIGFVPTEYETIESLFEIVGNLVAHKVLDLQPDFEGSPAKKLKLKAVEGINWWDRENT